MNKSIKEKICHICGKTFIPAVYHKYKSQGRLVCTYSCMLKGERDDKMKDIKELAKELCDKSSCHRKCHDTDYCIVEDEAELLISQSKDIEQIIEIKECIDAVYGQDCAYYDVDGFAIATEIYNAGWRKQSEVAREIFEEIDDLLIQHAQGDLNDKSLYFAIDELKKKYTESEDKV